MPERIDRAEPLYLLIDSTGLKIYGRASGLIRNTASGHAGDGASYISVLMPTHMKLSRWN